ncbi:MAG TPA: hypothetical protein VGM07_04055 [Stellaceae bacterium]|jgi:SagB-type dehydrogenase family enzyme
MVDAIVVLPPAPAASALTVDKAGALSEGTLGVLLGTLAGRPGPVPKYRYPSAGTLYPVQTYVIQRQRLGTLGPGSYYYDPDAHALAMLSSDAPAAPDGATPAVLLVLVAQLSAIEPIYRDEAEAFCLLEAGYMGEALHQTAAGLSLRDAGDPADGDTAALAAALRLDPSHRPLVCWALEAADR